MTISAISGLELPPEKYPSKEKWRVMKNVLVIGFAFMLHFTAFQGTANLQSSINSDASLGTFTLAAIYGSLLISNIILPVIVISWLGCKWTLAVSFLFYIPFIMAQFYPRVFTLIPGGLMVGFGGGPLWCAKCTYLSVIAEAYAEITKIRVDVITVRLFGIFFMFFQMAQVWGNLISSAVLSLASEDPSEENLSSGRNFTSLLEEYYGTGRLSEEGISTIESLCGANFCTANSTQVLQQPPENRIRLIMGIFLACMVMASIMISFGVDSLKRYSRDRVGPSGSVKTRLFATLNQARKPYQLLLLPITVFIGGEQAFMAADYTASYVACAYGIQNIGYVLICFGVMNAVTAIFSGNLVKIMGRYKVISVAIILFLVLFITLQIWKPRPDYPSAFFIIAAIWGMADALLLVQVNALSGLLFPGNEEAAYSNFRLWESTGSVITYIYSPMLCTRIKLYILLVIMGVGMSCYSTVEYLERKAKKGLPPQENFDLVTETKEPKESKDTLIQ